MKISFRSAVALIFVFPFALLPHLGRAAEALVVTEEAAEADATLDQDEREVLEKLKSARDEARKKADKAPDAVGTVEEDQVPEKSRRGIKRVRPPSPPLTESSQPEPSPAQGADAEVKPMEKPPAPTPKAPSEKELAGPSVEESKDRIQKAPAGEQQALRGRPKEQVEPKVSDAAQVDAMPETEPEKQAETQVRETTQAVERELNQRKSRIQGKEDAQTLIDQILGAESEISKAEVAREARIRPRIDALEKGQRNERSHVASPEQRREAVSYFQQRLRGQVVDEPPPALLRLPENRIEETREPTSGIQRERREQDEYRQPRYLREGRRYVPFKSRDSVPAILMAAEALSRVTLQPVREAAPIFVEQRGFSGRAMPLPPEAYRDEDAWVVSYPVDENSMITSDDILFQQGSTQFSDPASYEIVSALGDAMTNLPVNERFVIEGHASAEGSYDDNMVLSQQRAERIVREMVRRGVRPDRLLPVGYGESEARHPADDPEALRRQDRRVVVFRLKE